MEPSPLRILTVNAISSTNKTFETLAPDVFVVDDNQETVDDQDVTEEHQSNQSQKVIQRVAQRTESIGEVPKAKVSTGRTDQS